MGKSGVKSRDGKISRFLLTALLEVEELIDYAPPTGVRPVQNRASEPPRPPTPRRPSQRTVLAPEREESKSNGLERAQPAITKLAFDRTPPGFKNAK